MYTLEQLANRLAGKASVRQHELAAKKGFLRDSSTIKKLTIPILGAAISTAAFLGSFYTKDTELEKYALGPALSDYVMENVLPSRLSEDLSLDKDSIEAREEVDLAGNLSKGISSLSFFSSQRAPEELEQAPYIAKDDLLLYTKGSPNYKFIPFEDIPPLVTESLVSLEDKNFWSRVTGFDPLAVISSAAYNLRNLDPTGRGASTLEQQVARNLVLANWQKSFMRKYDEVMVAKELLDQFEKEEILELYVNTNGVAGGGKGLNSSAMHNFGVGIEQASDCQLLKIVSEFQMPSRFNHFADEPASRRRFEHVVQTLQREGVIDFSCSYDSLNFSKGQVFKKDPYLVDSATKEFVAIRDSLGLDADKPYLVQTTADIEANIRLEAVIDSLQKEVQKQYPEMNLTLAVISKKGEVLVEVGGDYEQDQFNLLEGKLNPGSVFKIPFAALAFEELDKPLSEVYVSNKRLFDSPLRDLRTQARYVRNHDYSETDSIRADSAFINSYNNSVLRLFENLVDDSTTFDQYFKEKVVPWYQRFGLAMETDTAALDYQKNPFDFNDVRPMFVMGSKQQGERILQLMSALMSFANGGILYEPRRINAVIENGQGVLYRAKDEGKQVISKEVADRTYELMNDIFHSSWTAKQFASAVPGAKEVLLRGASKTGTSRDLAHVIYLPPPGIKTYSGNEIGAIGVGIAGVGKNISSDDYVQNNVKSKEAVKFLRDVAPYIVAPMKQRTDSLLVGAY